MTADFSAIQKEWENQLRAEGYREVYVQGDPPETMYPVHTHDYKVAHIIIDGDMILTIGEDAHPLTSGERMDIPAGQPHSAMIGPRGCVYVIGQ